MSILKGISVIIGFLGALVLAYALYLYTTYIDDTVMSGEAYGFTIGIEKEDALAQASNNFKSENMYIIYPRDAQGVGPFKKIAFDNEDKKILREMGSWKLYYGENVRNSIEITFTDDILFSIYRRRQNFEVP